MQEIENIFMRYNPGKIKLKFLYRIILGWWFWVTNKNNPLAQARLNVCSNCEFRKWATCGRCGCVLQAKARIRDEECPEKKWPILGFKLME